MPNITIPITDLKHRLDIYRYIGACEIADALESRKATFGAMPGFNAALAVVDAERAKYQSYMMTKNVRLAAQHGVDLAQYYVSGLDGENLVCTPFEEAAQ